VLNAPKQLPLELPVKPRLSREDFIKGRANGAALQLVDSWPNWSASIAIIWGPEGSGKSHLANIWLEKSGAARVFAQDMAGLDSSAPSLIEDADAQHIDETRLFHVLNEARQKGAPILLTARKPPAAWHVGLPDLNSRLGAATIVGIEAPDDALLAAVLAKQFSDRQLAVEANVISYLVSRMERSLAAAAFIVDELDRLSLEKQTRISRALAALVVKDTDPLQAEFDI
jgi:chromosomal replication initiation ATPase DnaA